MRTDTRELLAVGIFGNQPGLVRRIDLLLRRGRTFSPRTSPAGFVAGTAVLSCLLFAGSLAPHWIAFAQQPPRPTFEVSSIKPVNAFGVSFGVGDGRASEHNVTLKMMIALAWRLQDFQISGGPSWAGSERFDIEATAENATTDPDQLRLMLQSLLQDRFKLSYHRETKNGPVYDLVIAKDGPRIKLAADQISPPVNGPSAPGAGPNHGAMRIGAGSLTGNAVTLSLFAKLLSQRLDRTIVDRTGLAGRYNIRLQWSPEAGESTLDPGGETLPSQDTSAPSIFAAIQEQLGLRLESVKAPIEVLVIDHAEKPDAN